MPEEKLIPLSKIRPKSEIDSVKIAKALGERRAFDVLYQAQQYWGNMSKFRWERERNKRYVFGDQWKDRIKVDGRWMTEEEYIKSQGNVPLKNNLMGKLVTSILGVYRNQSKEPTCTARDRDEQNLGETMSTVLQYNMELNCMRELNASTLKEFLISGVAVHRKWAGWLNDKYDCWTSYINPNEMIFDPNMRDLRGWDCSFIGEIHDISFETLVSQFAKSPKEYKRLEEIYSFASDRRNISFVFSQFGHANMANYDFLCTNKPGRCRVIEVWRKEIKNRYRCHDFNTGEIFKIDKEDKYDLVDSINERRIQQGLASGMPFDEIPLIEAEWFVDEYWYFYYLTPFGDILQEGETPYAHKSHPYVFKLHPFIDGEIHSFASDILDQQRYINRLITMHDWIMRASAKGLLLFPQECLPEGTNIEDIAEEWSRFNGVIAYKAKGNVQIPHQVANNSTNIGISELLNLQLKLLEEISGVNGALQGKPGYSGQSARLYAQQTQNATVSLMDLLDTFSSFIHDGAVKDVKNIQQFYDARRIVEIAGKNGASFVGDPEKIKNSEFDLSIVESTTTPVYREIQNDMLMEIWKAGQISLEQLLKCGHFPFADKLLQSIQSQQEQLQNGQIPQGISPELQQQVQQGANLNNVNRAYDMILNGAKQAA